MSKVAVDPFDPVSQADETLKREGVKAFVTIRKASEILGSRQETVWRKIQTGELPASRIGSGRGRWRIARIDLARFLCGSRGAA